MPWQRRRRRPRSVGRNEHETSEQPARGAGQLLKSRRRLGMCIVAAGLLLAVIFGFIDGQPRTSRDGPGLIPQRVASPPHKNIARCRSAFEHEISLADVTSDVIPKNNKPYFVLHIGPSKTGTTTLQKDSVRLRHHLELDNYVYLGRYAPRSLREPARISELLANDECRQEVSKSFAVASSSVPACWNERTLGIRAYHANHSNIIVSDEHFSYEKQLANICNDPDYWSTLRKSLFVDWNLMVVVTYRRYAEWILSVAKEVNQKVCHNPAHSSAQWEGQRCWPLWHLVETYLHTPAGDAFSYMNVDTTALAYSGVPVRILNLHAPTSLTSAFYCGVVPNALHTCRKLDENVTQTMENTQSSMTTVYNDIVFDASRAGLLRNQMTQKTRMQFTAEIAGEGSSMGLHMLDLPIICPRRSDLEILLKKSLELERLVVGSDNDDEHRRVFWKLADENKAFCKVDTARLLQGKTSWKQVVEHLQRLAGKTSFGTIA